MAGFNLRKTLGRSCHVCDQLSELGVRQAATHTVEASRCRVQKLLVSLVLPVMQKGLTCVARRFTSPSRFRSPIMAFIGPSNVPFMPSRKPIIRLDEAGFAAKWGSIT